MLVSTLAAGFVFVAGVVRSTASMEPALQSGSRCVVYQWVMSGSLAGPCMSAQSR